MPDFKVQMRTHGVSTGEKVITAEDSSEALKQIVGKGNWPEPMVIVLTLGAPDLDHVERELKAIVSIAQVHAQIPRSTQQNLSGGAS